MECVKSPYTPAPFNPTTCHRLESKSNPGTKSVLSRALKLVMPAFLANGKEGEATSYVLKCRCWGGSKHLQEPA